MKSDVYIALTIKRTSGVVITTLHLLPRPAAALLPSSLMVIDDGILFLLSIFFLLFFIILQSKNELNSVKRENWIRQLRPTSSALERRLDINWNSTIIIL